MTDIKTTLFSKLASILGTIKHVPKTGWNDFHKLQLHQAKMILWLRSVHCWPSKAYLYPVRV